MSDDEEIGLRESKGFEVVVGSALSKENKVKLTKLAEATKKKLGDKKFAVRKLKRKENTDFIVNFFSFNFSFWIMKKIIVYLEEHSLWNFWMQQLQR